MTSALDAPEFVSRFGSRETESRRNCEWSIQTTAPLSGIPARRQGIVQRNLMVRQRKRSRALGIRVQRRKFSRRHPFEESQRRFAFFIGDSGVHAKRNVHMVAFDIAGIAPSHHWGLNAHISNAPSICWVKPEIL